MGLNATASTADWNVKMVDSLSTRLHRVPLYYERIELFKTFPGFGRGKCLEISPLFQPLLTRENCNIDYCDYLPFQELVAREAAHPTIIEYGLEVQSLDFVWAPGRSLQECAPKGKLYNCIVSSHVLEHVPDFLGYLAEMQKLLADGGVILFALPNALGTPEVFRSLTSLGDMFEAYVFSSSSPSFRKVYDYYRASIPASEPYRGSSSKLIDYPRPHEVDVAVRDGLKAGGEYVDTHCWVFSPESFSDLMSEVAQIGLLDLELISVTETTANQFGRGYEFVCGLRKTASKRTSAAQALQRARKELAGHKGSDQKDSMRQIALEAKIEELQAAVKHGEKAFYEAVAVQESLKKRIANGEGFRKYISRFWARLKALY